MSATYFSQGPNRIGGKYRKTRFVQFTDGTFSRRVSRGAAEQHLGILGPVLEMEVGEVVLVTVRNEANRPYSFFPHGLQFRKEDEGFVYRNPDTNQVEGNVVSPGETTTYTFLVPQLGRYDGPCISRSYISAVDSIRDVQTGLIGPLLICNKGQLVAGSNSWYSGNKHIYLLFMTVNENLSWHLQYNIDTYTSDPANVNVSDAGFMGGNNRRSINGRMFGNLEGLEVCRGERVAWHLFSASDRFNMHGANFHGQALELDGNHQNSEVLVAGSAVTLTSKPETIGDFAVVCRTNIHFTTGMVAKYHINSCHGVYFQPQQLRGATRDFYIAAEEVSHDYAPLKRDLISGRPLDNPDEPGYIFVRNDTGYIGSVYKKVRYIRYTDASFRTQFPQGPEDEHLGVLGPVISGAVGDTLRVTFFNNASRPYSIHPEGVQYSKANEGATYNDVDGPTPGDSVIPGARFVYHWTVPDSAGPGPSDPDCVPWMYYSSVDSVKDMNTGLVGPLLTCRPGILNIDNNGKLRRRDVEAEFWQLYMVIDEMESWLLQDNIATFAPEANVNSSLFRNSNTMFSINGKIYGNVRGMTMTEGDRVAFHLISLGMQVHPVHFHGQVLLHQSAHKLHKGDVFEVFPSTTQTVSLLADNPGEWLVHCHLGPHANGGMDATYLILPAVSPTLHGIPLSTYSSGKPLGVNGPSLNTLFASNYVGNALNANVSPLNTPNIENALNPTGSLLNLPFASKYIGNALNVNLSPRSTPNIWSALDRDGFPLNMPFASKYIGNAINVNRSPLNTPNIWNSFDPDGFLLNMPFASKYIRNAINVNRSPLNTPNIWRALNPNGSLLNIPFASKYIGNAVNVNRSPLNTPVVDTFIGNPVNVLPSPPTTPVSGNSFSGNPTIAKRSHVTTPVAGTYFSGNPVSAYKLLLNWPAAGGTLRAVLSAAMATGPNSLELAAFYRHCVALFFPLLG